MHINERGSTVKTMCNTPHPPPFSRATSPALIVCLYLTYSKLLKLMVALNAGVYEKLGDSRRVSGRSLLNGHA